MIDVIGLDADDTLWHSQNHYDEAQAEAAALLTEWIDSDSLADRLLAVERRNIGDYGFGVKSFTLSLIETAIAVSEGAELVVRMKHLGLAMVATAVSGVLWALFRLGVAYIGESGPA